MDAPTRIAPDRLLDFAAAAYVRAGMPGADARLAADTLVQADLWGHQSHSVMRLSWYVARLKAGVCDPVARPEHVVDAGAIAVMDGPRPTRRKPSGASSCPWRGTKATPSRR